MKNKKMVNNHAYYCSTTRLTSEIIKKTIENLFPFDLDEP